MKTISWVLYVLLTNANGEPSGIVEIEARFESKEACREKAASMRLFSENYGCKPVFSDSDT